MHSSKQTKHSPGARLVALLVCAAVLVGVIYFLDFALYPCTFTRNDVHAVVSRPNDVILLGASNGKMGIDPDVLLEGTGRSGHNLCGGGQYPVDSLYLALLAAEKQDPDTIIYVVDPGYMMLEKEVGNNYMVFLHEFPLSKAKLEYAFATLGKGDFRSLFFPFYEYELSYELSQMKHTIALKAGRIYDTEDLSSETQAYHENGFIERFPVEQEAFPAYTPVPFDAEGVLPENEEALLKLIKLCREKEITLIAVAAPMYGGVLQSEAESWNNAWEYFGNLFAQEEVPFYNFNTQYYKAFTHDAKAFTDYDSHLNGDAARAFSHVLGQILFAEKPGEQDAAGDRQ